MRPNWLGCAQQDQMRREAGQDSRAKRDGEPRTRLNLYARGRLFALELECGPRGDFDRLRKLSTTNPVSGSHRQRDSAPIGVRTPEGLHTTNRAQVRSTTSFGSKSGSLGSTRSQARDAMGSTAATALTLAKWRRSFAFRTWLRPKPRPARQIRLRQRAQHLQPAAPQALR